MMLLQDRVALAVPWFEYSKFLLHAQTLRLYFLVSRSVSVWYVWEMQASDIYLKREIVIWTGNVNLLMLINGHTSFICSILSFHKILQLTSWRSIKDKVLRRWGLSRKALQRKCYCSERATEVRSRIWGKSSDFYSTSEPRTKSWTSAYKRGCSLMLQHVQTEFLEGRLRGTDVSEEAEHHWRVEPDIITGLINEICFWQPEDFQGPEPKRPQERSKRTHSSVCAR